MRVTVEGPEPQEREGNLEVCIVDVDIPFWSIFAHVAKLFFASIAFVIVLAMVLFVLALMVLGSTDLKAPLTLA